MRTFSSQTKPEGPNDERAELKELAKLPNRVAFWALFNQVVSPTTSYRIESYTLQLQSELF
jgi:hypothetical protein